MNVAVIMGIFDFVFRTKDELAIVLDWQDRKKRVYVGGRYSFHDFWGVKYHFWY